MTTEGATFILISREDLSDLVNTQKNILEQLKELNTKGPNGVTITHVTALEFMSIVKIGRSKFDQLWSRNKIKVIKKRRKLYVPIGEIDRYFTDPKIQ